MYTIGVESFIIGLQTDSTCQGISRYPTEDVASNSTLTITKFDMLSRTKIVSGTFSCDIPIPNCDTLHVTDGRL